MHVVIEIRRDEDVIRQRIGGEIDLELRIVHDVFGAANVGMKAGAIPPVDVVEIHEWIVLGGVATM